MEEICATLDAHIKETITLASWSREYLEADATEKQILQDWGISQLPLNNSRLSKLVPQANNVKLWQKPPTGAFKLNFDGVSKGNLGPAVFGGVIRDSHGRILSLYWGILGSSTNNLEKLDGLLNGLAWAI